MAKRKAEQSELPPIRMARRGMSLVPIDAFSEEMLDGIRFNAPLDVRWTYEVVDPKRVKFWAILNNVIKNCATPWTNSKAAASALKAHLGVVDESLSVAGGTIRYPMSLNELTDPEFDIFYEGAMAVLHRITGIDPESLKRAAPRVSGEAPARNEPSTDKLAPAVRAEVERRGAEAAADQRPFAPLPGEEQPAEVERRYDASDDSDGTRTIEPSGSDEAEADYDGEGAAEGEALAANLRGGGEAESNVRNLQMSGGPAADEVAMVGGDRPNRQQAFIAEFVVDEMITAATKVTDSKEQREAEVDVISKRWVGNFPDMAAFIGTVSHHAKRVAKGDLRANSAKAYLISIGPKAR